MKSPKHILTFIIILFVIVFFQFANPQSAQAACAPNHIIYVRPTGTNAGGCSWATAFTTLQSALAIATSGDQIWVASGTYYPDEGTGQTNNDQASTFVLINGVSLYGGFAGTPGTEALFVRNSNPATNNTILSGDIDQDGMDADNTFIVVTVTGILTDTFILDGFTITNGYEDSGSGQGGGIYIEETSPTLTNLIVTNNFATSNGGGIYTITVGFNPADETTYNRPALTNVTISNNTAARGGGIYTRNSSPILTNVTVSSNAATGGAGGGMNNQTNSTSDTPSIPRLSNVTFSNNTANGGGALFNGDSNAILTNITFSGNTANIRGGAVLNEGSNPVFRNVTFSGNTAPAGTGGAIRNVIGGAPANKNTNPFIYNSILWGDTAGGGSDEITSDGAGATTITDSVVENGCQPISSTCINIITTNPNLGALLPNAPGLTQTRAISIGSSALDTGGVNVACAATDQRGIIRPQGAACDIGAFESEGNSTTTTVGNASATYGAISVNLTATVSSNPGGGTVQFYINGSPVGAPVSVNAGDGTATFSYNPSALNAGTYTIRADFSGFGSFLSSSSNPANNGTLTINQRAATVTPNAASKVYGDLDPAPLTTGTLIGFLPADNVTATYSRTAGETVAGGPYTISATLSPAGVLGNYNITYNTANFTITQRPASVTPNAANKVYGDLDPAPLTTGILTGFLPADNVTASYTRTAGESVAGSPYTISATLSPAGVLGNYNVTYNTANFTITQMTASVTPNNASKAYGAADPAPLTTGTLTGFLPADNVTATYSRIAGETVAGSPYTINATLNPAGVLGNYNITYNTANFTITGTIVTPTIIANNKVYDDTNTATFTCTLTGVVGTDDVTCSGGTATFNNQNVATNKLVTATGLTLSGADIASYTLASTTATDTADITARTLNVTATGINKPYDGNTTATVTLGDDRLVGDVLTLSYTSAAFLNPNVGIGKTVNVSGISISGGADSGNYTLASTAAATTADIAAIVASVTPNNASKVYGNLDPAPLTTGILTGFLPADNVTATYARTAGETVAGSPYTISATLSPAGVLGNYIITYNTANFTITQRPASVTPNDNSKVYGAADPVPLTTGTLTGFLPADNVTATYSRTAGETVPGSPYIISATLNPAGVLGNYNITYNTANFIITGTIVTPTIIANNKVYDDTNTATFTCTLTGVVGTDDVNCSGGTATFTNQNVGTNKLVTATGLTLSGADIASYTLASTAATDTADITQRTLNVTATGVNKLYDGNTTATVTLSDDRLVGDILTLTYTSATFLNPNVGIGKTVNVSGITISGGADAGNYTLASTAAATTADITPITASVTPNNAGKAFGATDPIPLTTGTLSGFLAGDGVTATYTRAAGEAVGPYTISATLNPAGVLGNYNITYNTATFTIGQTTPTITWSNPANITYGTALSGTQLNATASVPGTFTYTPSAGAILNAGNGQNLHVDFVPTDTATYTNASADVTINVNKAGLTVVANNQSINFGDPDPAFTFTYSSFVPGDTSADIDTPPTCTVSGPHTNVGTYPIVCSGGTDNNYSFSYVNGTLSVGLVSQTITVNTPAPGTLLFPGNSFTVAATASSGLPVVYSASGSCTNSGATFTMTAGTPGVCTVVYDQPGNANYGPAPQLTDTVGIALVVITNGINSNTDTGDGRLAEFEAASVAITQLTVNFNKDVDNPAGNTLTDDVTNSANYILVADNGDGIQTSSCNVGVTGGDLVIPVNTAAYNNNGGSGPFVATMSVNGGSALPIGTYRLIVCGTTSIVDLTGTPLAGNGLASGTDFIRNFSVTSIAPTSTAKAIPDTGFPQNKVTVLPIQPADKAYASTDLWLEIPKLGVKMSIVGVPQTKAGWDVTWLDKNAGWLNGSAFPTWQGNSVITAHVWDALNKPGPFAGLKELKYGDQIKIHAFGQVFTYELRESTVIAPTNTAAMLKHEEKSWLTLITCEDYKELTQKYPYRRMVRAVLVSVTAEK